MNFEKISISHRATINFHPKIIINNSGDSKIFYQNLRNVLNMAQKCTHESINASFTADNPKTAKVLIYGRQEH